METRKIEVIKDIHEENELIAQSINEKLTEKGIYTVNVLGSPGAGKTSTLIQIIKRLAGITSYVVEGDIESDIDTKKLQALGIQTFQINTGGACHLDSPILASALEKLNPTEKGVLFIENIGNLVCPAEFVIGEHIKMLIASVAEGSDKPYKYPLAFEKADIVILNKCDLKPYIDFDADFFNKGVKALNKNAPVFEVSAKTGEGFEHVVQWLEAKRLK